MNRLLPYLLGPEMYWFVVCVVVRLSARRGSPPDPAVTDSLDSYWAVLPLVAVPLTFLFFFLPFGGRWWLLLRIDVAVAIGMAIATTQYCEGMTYHEPSSGPGAGTAWMLMLALGYMILALGTIVAAGVIAWRSRASG